MLKNHLSAQHIYCVWGAKHILPEKYHSSQKYTCTPTPLFDKPLNFIAHGRDFCLWCLCFDEGRCFSLVLVLKTSENGFKCHSEPGIGSGRWSRFLNTSAESLGGRQIYNLLLHTSGCWKVMSLLTAVWDIIIPSSKGRSLVLTLSVTSNAVHNSLSPTAVNTLNLRPFSSSLLAIFVNRILKLNLPMLHKSLCSFRL